MEDWRLLLLLLPLLSLHIDVVASQRFGMRRAGVVLWGISARLFGAGGAGGYRTGWKAPSRAVPARARHNEKPETPRQEARDGWEYTSSLGSKGVGVPSRREGEPGLAPSAQ